MYSTCYFTNNLTAVVGALFVHIACSMQIQLHLTIRSWFHSVCFCYRFTTALRRTPARKKPKNSEKKDNALIIFLPGNPQHIWIGTTFALWMCSRIITVFHSTLRCTHIKWATNNNNNNNNNNSSSIVLWLRPSNLLASTPLWSPHRMASFTCRRCPRTLRRTRWPSSITQNATRSWSSTLSRRCGLSRLHPTIRRSLLVADERKSWQPRLKTTWEGWIFTGTAARGATAWCGRETT